MHFYAQYYQNSMVVGDLYCQKICDTAKENDIHVVMGFSEKEGGSLYIFQVFIGREGLVLGSRRKLKPTNVERMLFGEGDGSGFQVYDLDIGKLGGLNCWEHFQPLSKYAMYSFGEQVHAASWPSFAMPPGGPYSLGAEASTAASQVYALEGQCYVLMAVAVVDKLMIETLVDTEEKAQFLQMGGGFANAFGPDGRPLVKTLPENEEGILIAEIDLSMIVFGKWLADPVGHYSRPDVTRLLLNPNPSPRVQYMETPMTITDPSRTDPEEGEQP